MFYYASNTEHMISNNKQISCSLNQAIFSPSLKLVYKLFLIMKSSIIHFVTINLVLEFQVKGLILKQEMLKENPDYHLTIAILKRNFQVYFSKFWYLFSNFSFDKYVVVFYQNIALLRIFFLLEKSLPCHTIGMDILHFQLSLVSKKTFGIHLHVFYIG